MMRQSFTISLLLLGLLLQAQPPLSVDDSFHTNITETQISDIHVLQNGQIMITGLIRFGLGGTTSTARLLPNGGRDIDFQELGGSGGQGVFTPGRTTII